MVIILLTLTAQQYIDDILLPVVFPFLSWHLEFSFQLDNCRLHTAIISTDVLGVLRSLLWIPGLPNFTPVVYFWNLISTHLTALLTEFSTPGDMMVRRQL